MVATSFDSHFSPLLPPSLFPPSVRSKKLFNKPLLILSLMSYHQYSVARGALLLASCVPVINAHIEFFSLPRSLASLPTDDRQETALNLSTNGISSINMSMEINGVVYTGK